MVNVDPDGKSDKTLKTEELEVLVRLLNSNLESLRLLPREASIQRDVALNNRLLTARISALSALITFLSEGEISQIVESNRSNATTLSRETTESTIPSIPVSNLGSLVDYDTDDDDEDEDDDDNKSNDEDHDDKGNDEEKEITEPTPIRFSGPRPNIFPTIRPLMEIFHTGIQEAPSPTRSPPNFPENDHIEHRNDYDRPNIIPPSPPTPTPGLGRSEYETRDISSIDQKRRPVHGVPAPVLQIPSQAITGGAGHSRGNLHGLRRSRRPVFPSSKFGVFGDGFPSSVDNVDNPRKRRLEEGDYSYEEEDEEEEQGGIRDPDEYMRAYGLANQDSTKASTPLLTPPTPPLYRQTPSERKAKRSKLSSENQNITYPLSFSTFDSSPDIALFRTTASSGAIAVCHDPGPSSSTSTTPSPSNTFDFAFPYQTPTEEASEDKDAEVEAATTTITGKGKARNDESDEDSSHTPLHEEKEKEESEEEDEGKSNRDPNAIFFPAPSGLILDVPGSLRLVVDSGGPDNPSPESKTDSMMDGPNFGGLSTRHPSKQSNSVTLLNSIHQRRSDANISDDYYGYE